MSTTASADTKPNTISATASAKVWLITGCSSGIGRALALAALARGDRVIATARSLDKLEALEQRGAVAVELDVTSPDDVVRETVAAAAARVGGRIDILVNNAGYSLVGSAEECSADEIAAVFNTNVFGVYRMVRTVLPYMRAQRSGVIANIGSLGGRRSFPAASAYCATKFAVAGLSESLRAEVAHLGIDVTCVDLGSFRTDFGNKSVDAKTPSADAGPAVAQMKAYLVQRNGKQPGDPARGAAVLVDALTKTGSCAGRALPVRLPLGGEAVAFITSVLERDQQDLRTWVDVVSSTDHDDAANSPKLL